MAPALGPSTLPLGHPSRVAQEAPAASPKAKTSRRSQTVKAEVVEAPAAVEAASADVDTAATVTETEDSPAPDDE